MPKKKSKKKASASSSGGTMMSMRSGFKAAVGQGQKKRKKGKKQWSFGEVFFYGFLVALVLVLIWQLKQG